MFVSCPHCNFLVALGTDDQPPARCPRCARPLRDDAGVAMPHAAAPQSAMPGTPSGMQGDESPPGTGGNGPAPPSPLPDYIPWRTLRVPAAEPPAAVPVATGANDASVARDAGVEAGAVAEGRQDSALETELATTAVAEPEPTPGAVQQATAVEEDVAGDAPSAAIEAAAENRAGAEALDAPSADDTGMQRAEPEPMARDPAVAAADDTDDGIANRPHGVPETRDEAVESQQSAGAGEASTPTAGASAAPARTRKRATNAPSFVRTPVARMPVGRRRQQARIAAIAALSLLLALQLLLSERAALAADARWRPLVSTLCGALGCTLPAWREPRAIQVMERDVRAHPSIPGVLRVTARMRNDARWAQPWPLMRLTLSDVHGRDVAARRFQPREYLGGTPTQAGLASGQVAALSMDIVEPGTQAVAFTFDFE